MYRWNHNSTGWSLTYDTTSNINTPGLWTTVDFTDDAITAYETPMYRRDNNFIERLRYMIDLSDMPIEWRLSNPESERAGLSETQTEFIDMANRGAYISKDSDMVEDSDELDNFLNEFAPKEVD